jgi:crotonobetainyl-CoA:carnitine CoA-transferase CaiB-like acyl-CoA transferase
MGRRRALQDLAARWRTRMRSMRLVGSWTKSRDAYETMLALQRAGVPAGVCQTAGDRCDNDPQLQRSRG